MNQSGKNQSNFPINDFQKKFFEARNVYNEQSQKLFVIQQEFLKKLEDYKTLQQEIDQKKQNYIDQMTKVALKQAELAFKKQILLQEETKFSEITDIKLQTILEARKKLEKALIDYREVRKQISIFQKNVGKRTELQRIDCLNSIAFCNYAKSILEEELRKISSKTITPPKKELAKIISMLSKKVEKAREEFKTFHTEKITEFRRNERIILGRSRELVEIEGKGTTKVEDMSKGEILMDSLEHRIAQRFLVSKGLQADNLYQDISDSEDDNQLPELPLTAINPNLLNLPTMESTRKTRRLSITKDGDIVQFLDKLNNTKGTNRNTLLKSKLISPDGKSSGQPPDTARTTFNATTSSNNNNTNNQKQANNLSNQWVVYDPSYYSQAIKPDFIRPHTLLDTNPRLNEKEFNLSTLVTLCCQSKGKLKEMKNIRDNLDIELLKQASMLLTLIRTICQDNNLPNKFLLPNTELGRLSATEKALQSVMKVIFYSIYIF